MANILENKGPGYALYGRPLRKVSDYIHMITRCAGVQYFAAISPSALTNSVRQAAVWHPNLKATARRRGCRLHPNLAIRRLLFLAGTLPPRRHFHLHGSHAIALVPDHFDSPSRSNALDPDRPDFAACMSSRRNVIISEFRSILASWI